uniref:Uncharacterized protein n=1 Tax=Caenorhabditis japonica TaxID=281687 RepID=A0A8R1DRG1_CAEJA
MQPPSPSTTTTTTMMMTTIIRIKRWRYVTSTVRRDADGQTMGGMEGGKRRYGGKTRGAPAGRGHLGKGRGAVRPCVCICIDPQTVSQRVAFLTFLLFVCPADSNDMKWWWAICSILSIVEGKRISYSEEDQMKYLQDIKQQELNRFEMEMKQQSAQRGSQYSASRFGVQLDSGGSQESTNLPSELRGPSSSRRKYGLRHHHENKPAQAQALRAAPMKDSETVPLQNNEFLDETDNEDHWCYYCATPIDKVRPEMRKSIRNLLEMRRTAFPIDAVTPECLSARNLTKLKKQRCSYKYCQTLSIVDRNAGNSFVVRGCAEHFGAINVAELEKKNDHSCQMLHEKLEIKECICKTSKYCHAGWTKRSASDSYRQSYSVLALIISLIVLYC